MIELALKRLSKGSLIYGVGSILQRFMSVLLLPFFTRALSTADYGVVALISVVSAAVTGLFTLGTGNSMGILYYRETDAARRPTIIWSNVVMLSVNILFLYIVLFFLSPLLSQLMFQSPKHANLIRLSFLGLVFSTVADPFLAYLRMEEKAKRYVVLTLYSSLLSIGLSILLVLVLKIGVAGVILAQSITQGVMLLLVWAIIGRRLAFKVDRTLFRPLVRIGFPSIFGVYASLLIDYADHQMLAQMAGLDSLGIYSVGYSFGIFMAVLVGAFDTAWPPFFMSYINKIDEAKMVFARVLTYYVIVFGALIVLFFAAARPVLLLFTAPNFHQAHLVVGLVAAAYMLNGCFSILGTGIYFIGKLHLLALFKWFAAFLNIGLNFILIPHYGIVGAAVATFISYLCMSLLVWFFSRKYLQVDYQWARVVRVVVTVVIAAVSIYWMSKEAIFFETVFINFIICIVFFGLTFFLLLETSERQLIYCYRKKFVKFVLKPFGGL